MACQALDHRCTLTKSKSKLYKDFEGIKKKRPNLANTSAKVKASLTKVKSSKAKLEERVKELAKKESKLLKYEEKTNAATNALKDELKEKLSRARKPMKSSPSSSLQ